MSGHGRKESGALPALPSYFYTCIRASAPSRMENMAKPWLWGEATRLRTSSVRPDAL
ncbi:hypothetical protein FOMPIDRAFT_123383 [Fomitopsis schrenkii]|uniref:Uncharacterized protein n=1 Tax=Fomitopsis schrenkii TaxID=2126942 RepID=S8DW44_FOMSC|nr:hypothetical protein FOMPIDRAFT_123383 [Fomitopsis schrenkii]